MKEGRYFCGFYGTAKSGNQNFGDCTALLTTLLTVSWEPQFSTVHLFDEGKQLRKTISDFVSSGLFPALCPSPRIWKVKALSIGQTRVIQKVALLGSFFLCTKLAVAS